MTLITRNRTITTGSWEMQFGEDISIASNILSKLGGFINQHWLPAFKRGVKNPWYGLQATDFPSPMLRVDMAPTKNKEEVIKNIYEVEVRPGGLGVMTEHAPINLGQWQYAFSQCGGFVVGDDTHIQDDVVAAKNLGLKIYSLDKIPAEGGPFWFRTAKCDQCLDQRSIVPIADDGLKQDLVNLGLARVVKNASEVNWDLPQVFKPLQGTWCKEIKNGKVGEGVGVEIYAPFNPNLKLENFFSEQARGSALQGFSKKSKVEKMLSAGSEIISQPFAFPERIKCQDSGKLGWRIWRLYYGLIDGKYQFMGGVWAWRTTIKVHGASDAIFGFITE